MPEALLRDLGMNVRSQHVARVAMPEPVQGNAPFFQKGRNDMRKAPRLQRRAISLRDDVPTIVRGDPEPQQLLSLRQPPATQLLDRQGGQGDRSRVAALGFFSRIAPESVCSVLATTAS